MEESSIEVQQRNRFNCTFFLRKGMFSFLYLQEAFNFLVLPSYYMCGYEFIFILNFSTENVTNVFETT